MGAATKLKEASAAENYEVIIDILESVKQLIQDQGKTWHKRCAGSHESNGDFGRSRCLAIVAGIP